MKNQIKILLLTIFVFMSSCTDPVKVEDNQNVIPDNQIFFTRAILSPDGSDVISGATYSINSNGTGMKLLKNNALLYSSPRGNLITYTVVDSNNPKLASIYTSKLDGSGEKLVLKQVVNGYGGAYLSPGGEILAYYMQDGIYLMNLDGTDNLKLSQSSLYASGFAYSNKTKKIAFISGSEVFTDSTFYLNICNYDGTVEQSILIPDFYAIRSQSPINNIDFSPDELTVIASGYSKKNK